MNSRIIFLGSSPMIGKAVQWLESNKIAFLIFTNQAQALKFPLLHSLEREKVVVTEDASPLSNFDWSADDIAISVGAPWIFKDEFIESFKGRALLNLHGSQLPMYRGGNLFSWFVLNGVRTGTAVLHHLKAELDAGPIAFSEEFLYPSNCRKPIDYIQEYEAHNSSFLLNCIEKILVQGQPIQINAQPHYLSTYWPRLKSDLNGWIDWSIEGGLLERFVLAFDDPYGGASTYWRNNKITIKDVHFQPGFNHHPYQNGIIFRNNGRWLNVAVGGGELIVCEIMHENRKLELSMVRPGDRFMTPFSKIAMSLVRTVKRSGNQGLSAQVNVLE